MPAPLIYLGIAVGGTLGAIVGLEAQERYDSHRARRNAEADQQEADLRMQALRIAAHEQAVRDESARQGIDVGQVLADLEAGQPPRVDDQKVMGVLERALSGMISTQARAAIDELLNGVQS